MSDDLYLKAWRDAVYAYGGMSSDCDEELLAAAILRERFVPRVTGPHDALIERLQLKNEQLAVAVRCLMQLAIDAGITDDLVAQVFPNAKRKNGQPADEFTKRARRTINEARASLENHNDH